MSLPLCPFPATASLAAAATLALEWRPDGGIDLRYEIAGALDLRLPAPVVVPGPADELWRHTCCELFVEAGDGPAYREFNFSPSGQWAVYDFTAYRERAADPAVPPIAIACLTTAGGFALNVALPAGALPGAGPWRLGATLVLEAADGALAYWALAHPGEKPDFHDRRAFTFLLDGVSA